MALAVGEASSSSSPSSAATPRLWTYHVFLSFRGEDTRKSFTDHLYAALDRKGIKTFRDDKYLETGEVISHELVKAIEESMFAITVLSPNYASSAWCLDELQKIVECKDNKGLSIVPVFYGVEPSDVRYQKGSFEKAFKKHEERYKHNHEKIKSWRNSLTQVASYSGWDSKNQNEATLVESIAEHIHKRLIPKLTSCTENLVGISSKVEEVIRLVRIGLNDVRFVGIWGMGGIGKTTIARVVYEAIQGEFKSSCFLANIREACETKNDCVDIQKELVSYMNLSASSFNNEYDGRKIIQNSLCNKKVVLVLDDVSEVSQLENLAGKSDWFGPGSKVIITTRDMHLLQLHGAHDTYEVRCLDQNQALHLFCSKAFKQDQAEEGYLEMCNEVVEYTGGLPLALVVLGSYLYRRNIDVWRSAVEKIKSSPPSKILDTLKISYDGLDSMEKNIFLDIACFYKGMKKDRVIDILLKFGYNPEIVFAILSERSLISINPENMVDMHDLLQEMGRNIVIQESPNDPGKRSRLWSKQDIHVVLTQDKGTEAIQGIALSVPFGKTYTGSWSTEVFARICQLKLLQINAWMLPTDLNCLPSSLKVLDWEWCPLKTLPLADQTCEVVEIKLVKNTLEQLWCGKKFLGQLKYLNLTCSRNLKRTPDFSGVPFLETLILQSCMSLVDVHPSLLHHQKLILLNLSGCRRLKTLPGELEMSSLKELILDGCSSFEDLPDFGECMVNLSKLSLEGTAIRKLRPSLGCLVGLSVLNLACCNRLTCIPSVIHELKSLKILSLSECQYICQLLTQGFRGTVFKSVSRLPLLSSLHMSYCSLTGRSFAPDFCYFPLLVDLNLSYNTFSSVPISLRELPKLKCLRINGCSKLELLPELPSSIAELEAWKCDSLNIFEFNNLSKASGVFASIRQNRGQVLQMLMSREEIPSWFAHQEQGNCVSIPHPPNFPQNERLGVALCFLFQIYGLDDSFETSLTMCCNGKSCITTKRIFPGHKRLPLLYIIYLNNEYFSDQFHQNSCFELLAEEVSGFDFIFLCSAARWVHNHDFKGFEGKE